ncbi:hypothetical protein [Aquihabitans sp. McL0605]|uniref:hypothetical protein n=1 Tax=Aquihabitans sp. McL0605 TaxID=3415671 RepID=UPI003CE98EEA
MHLTFTRGKTGLVVGIVLSVLGVALLATTYHKELDVDVPAGAREIEQPAPTITCEAPIVDGFHDEPQGWVNYAPNTGVAFAGHDTFSGSWCKPESVQRGTLGLTLLSVGALILVVPPIRRRRAGRASEPIDHLGAPVVFD